MKSFKRLVAFITASVLIFLACYVNDAVMKAANTDYGSNVMQMQVAGKTNKLYVYYPMPNASTNTPVFWAGIAPVYMVFGDGDMSKEECIKYANESGLAAIAAENGSSILFVQPSSDDWSDKDAGVYESVVGMANDASFNKATNGVIDSGRIAGEKARTYVYGIGAGADFIVNHSLKAISINTNYGPSDCTMASATLEGVSNISGLTSNDIPTVSINNSEEINKALKEANTNGMFLQEATRDYATEAKNISGCYFRQSSTLVKVHDYAAEGIKQSIESLTVTANDKSLSKPGTKLKMGYVLYYSDQLKVKSSKDKYPLVLALHGGGGSALNHAMTTEWPTIAKENGFMLACVDGHSSFSTSDMILFIKALEKSYPGIDKTRIYVTGFSQGSQKTWSLLEQYPEVFAGAAPMNGTSLADPVTNIKKDTIIPTFYVAGETSPLGEYATTSSTWFKVKDAVTVLFSANNITDKLKINSKVNKWWGVKPNFSYQVTDTQYFKNSVLTVNLFKSKDGNCYTALANSSNTTHECRANNCQAAWDFLRQFSRSADGKIVIKAVTYNYPSDDGKIVNNSYNKTGTFKAKH